MGVGLYALILLGGLLAFGAYKYMQASQEIEWRAADTIDRGFAARSVGKKEKNARLTITTLWVSSRKGAYAHTPGKIRACAT